MSNSKKLESLEGLWFTGDIGLAAGFGMGGLRRSTGFIESKLNDHAYIGKLVSGARVVIHDASMSVLRFYENREELEAAVKAEKERVKKVQEKQEKLQKEMIAAGQSSVYGLGINSPLDRAQDDNEE